MKKVALLINILLLLSCSKGEEHDCVCYDNLGTDSVTYKIYTVKNTKSEADKYCSKISSSTKPCWISK